MRSKIIAAAPALIAAAALVAIAGPTRSGEPGRTPSLEPDAFRPLFLERRASSATAFPQPDPGLASAGALQVDSILLEPVGTAMPTARPAASQPAPKAAVVLKSPWRTAEYSWYGPGFYGSGTACGQTYSKTILGVAHRTLPCGTKVTLRNPKNGRTITVRVIDRGPYVSGRMWDLSRATCDYLDNCYTSMIQWRLP